MVQPTTKKLCQTCGADVTETRRHKTRHGTYQCWDCYSNRPQIPSEHEPALKSCSECAADVPREAAWVNRHGKFICQKCYESKKARVSRRRRFFRRLKRIGQGTLLWSLRITAGLVASAIAVKVFLVALERLTAPVVGQ